MNFQIYSKKFETILCIFFGISSCGLFYSIYLLKNVNWKLGLSIMLFSSILFVLSILTLFNIIEKKGTEDENI